MGESFLYVAAGAVLGLVLAATALRPLNAFLDRTIDFSMFADWRVAGATLVDGLRYRAQAALPERRKDRQSREGKSGGYSGK